MDSSHNDSFGGLWVDELAGYARARERHREEVLGAMVLQMHVLKCWRADQDAGRGWWWMVEFERPEAVIIHEDQILSSCFNPVSEWHRVRETFYLGTIVGSGWLEQKLGFDTLCGLYRTAANVQLAAGEVGLKTTVFYEEDYQSVDRWVIVGRDLMLGNSSRFKRWDKFTIAARDTGIAMIEKIKANPSDIAQIKRFYRLCDLVVGQHIALALYIQAYLGLTSQGMLLKADQKIAQLLGVESKLGRQKED